MITTEEAPGLEEKKPAPDIKTRLKGFNGYCGLEFAEVGDDHCTIRCPLRPELLNPAGMAHGGLIATMTDVAAGMMALQIDQWTHNIVTQSCDIHYLRPGSGNCLYAVSRVIRKGRRVCVVQVDCLTEDDKLFACATYEISYLDERS